MEKSLPEMRETVFAAKPVFAHVLHSRGPETLYDYFLNMPKPVSVSDERKEEFLSVFEDILVDLIGEEAARIAAQDLSVSWYVSTADHHGPLTHPFFSNSAIMHSYAARAAGRSSVVVLSCGGISIDNSSFPRGFLLHDEEGKEVRLHLIDRTKSNQPVYSRAPYTALDLSKIEKEIAKLGVNASVVREALIPALQEALPLSTYSEQMTRFNTLFWKHVPGQENTNLVYLEQESLVRELILRKHIDRDTFIRSVLSDSSLQESIEKQFDGIMGAFDLETKKGTFLFWGIEDGRRVALTRGDTRIASIEAIRSGLESRTLMPSMLLSFIVLSFYYGITCGGGFSQVNYLTDMKAAFLSVLKECNHSSEFPHLTDLNTGFFCGEFILGTVNRGSVISATPLDLVLEQDGASTSLREAAETVSLSNAVDGIIPELYRIVAGGAVSESDKERYTLSIHEEKTVPLLRE